MPYFTLETLQVFDAILKIDDAPLIKRENE